MRHGICQLGARLHLGFAMLGFGIMLAPGAMADDLGEELYARACAICHGNTGDGNGYYREYLKIEPGALTGLSAANDGEFPLGFVIDVIDGRAGIRAHGSQMPIWGTVFETRLNGDRSDDEKELRARGIVLSLADYLHSVQE